MDNSVVAKHYELVARHYPDMSLTQLGMTCAMLGVIRASMGHENAIGTIENYIHPSVLSPEVRQCLDFLEREVLGVKKSKIDIDFWKKGNTGEFRRDDDKAQTDRVSKLSTAY